MFYLLITVNSRVLCEILYALHACQFLRSLVNKMLLTESTIAALYGGELNLQHAGEWVIINSLFRESNLCTCESQLQTVRVNSPFSQLSHFSCYIFRVAHMLYFLFIYLSSVIFL